MNTKEQTNNIVLDSVVLKDINIFHQYLRSFKKLLIIDAYSKIKRSKNELEK